MKKLLFSSFIIFLAIACKKTDYAAKGPTDIRVRNLSSDFTFSEVIVNTSATIDTLGDITPGQVSEYFRFKEAYPKAEISAKINDLDFTTGPVDFTYLNYIGQERITYEVYISNMNERQISINNVIIEEPLILK